MTSPVSSMTEQTLGVSETSMTGKPELEEFWRLT
jgi:hypothetical protein